MEPPSILSRMSGSFVQASSKIGHPIMGACVKQNKACLSTDCVPDCGKLWVYLTACTSRSVYRALLSSWHLLGP